AVSGANGQRSGKYASDAMASSRATNHFMPVSPAPSVNNHARMASPSLSASAVVSTRNAILPAHVFEERRSRADAASPYVFIALSHGLHGRQIVLLFPFEVCGQ